MCRWLREAGRTEARAKPRLPPPTQAQGPSPCGLCQAHISQSFLSALDKRAGGLNLRPSGRGMGPERLTFTQGPRW